MDFFGELFTVELFLLKKVAAGNKVDENGESESKQQSWPRNQNSELEDAK